MLFYCKSFYVKRFEYLSQIAIDKSELEWYNIKAVLKQLKINKAI